MELTNKNMTEVTPAAEAVWHAYETADCDPYETDPRRAGLAAALRAVADQATPSNGSRRNNEIRAELLAIAAELRGITTETP